jgi:sarcosine oxidase
MERNKTFDVIVIGVGSMGSAACYYLAQRGAKVLGLEQFDSPHTYGSHAGQSRIIRKAYFEHPDYVPLLERAYANWHALEQASGEQVYEQTGLLYFSRPDHMLVSGTIASSTAHHIPLERLDESTIRKKYPQVELPTGYTGLMESDAGFVRPEKAIQLYRDLSEQAGAEIRTQTRVLSWSGSTDGVEVRTDKGNAHGLTLIITAGPWAGMLIPELQPKLQVTRQVLAWVTPENPEAYKLGHWPCWTIGDDDQPGIYYGFPILPEERFGGPIGFKLAHHAPGLPCSASDVSRAITEADIAGIQYCLDRYFPNIRARMHVLKTCLYTNTPDEHFIIDHLPETGKKVIFAAGFSGHGFKFVSVVGEILADLVIKGRTELPADFLRLSRFHS